MRATSSLLTSALAIAFAGTANAVPVVIQFDDFESIGNGGISQDATFEANSGWTDVTLEYNALNAPTAPNNNNARSDISGHDGSGGNAGRGMRVRSSTGSATLDSALQLATLNADSVTISYDINLDDDDPFTIGLYFANNAGFSNALELTTWTSDGSDNGGWFSESFTVNAGDVTGGFTDDSWFMLGRLSRGNGANRTFHSFDNIEISYEATSQVVPEPSSLALGLIALGGLAARRRRG